MGRPVVEHFNTNIFLNTIIDAADFFSTVDIDGDAILKYFIEDYQSDPTGGSFRVDGIAQPNGTQFMVTAAQVLSGAVEYISGSRIGWEGFRVIAVDERGEFSTAADSGRLYTVRENVTRPTVANLPFDALADESTSIAPFVQGFDSDGYPITQYYIRDQFVNAGYLTINGVAVEQGEYQLVKTEDLPNVAYNTGGAPFTENLQVFAYDGELWSVRRDIQISSLANVNRPVAQFTRGDVISRDILDMEPLANITDDDGNSIKWYEFWNTSPHAVHGDLIFQGTVLPRKEWVRIQAEDLGDLRFQSPNVDFVQQIRYRGFDGKFRSGNSTISITTTFEPVPAPPTIEAVIPQINVEQVEKLNVQSMFNAQVVGEPITRYEIFDGNSSNLTGEFLINDEPLQRGVIHTFSPIGFASVDYNSGPYIVRSNESIYARAGNDSWSPWARVNIHTEPEFIGAFQTNPVNPANWRDVLNQQTGTLSLSYSYMQTFPDYETGSAVNNDEPPEQFSQFTLEQRVATNRGLANLETFANVEFVQIADSETNELGQQGGILRFGNYFLEEPEASAFAFFPSGSPEAGDSWYDLNVLSSTNWGEGTFEYSTLLHEVGHAMGLKHPHGGPDNMEPGPWLPDDTDHLGYSVMSYTGRPTDPIQPKTYQIYDILNLQELYGANTTYETGDNLYDINFIGNPRSAQSVWDAGGTDEFSAAGTTENAVIDLRPGQFSSIGGTPRNLGLAFNVEIENATGGTGDDSITGNFLSNTLVGGDGRDVLIGRGGNDILMGGADSDIYEWGVADGDDVIDEERLQGRDRIRLTDFPQLDSLEEDLMFKLDGRDLIIDLRLDGNTENSDGTLRITNQLFGSWRIETLELNGTDIDLRNLAEQATSIDQKFQLTGESTVFGGLVAPA